MIGFIITKKEIFRINVSPIKIGNIFVYVISDVKNPCIQIENEKKINFIYEDEEIANLQKNNKRIIINNSKSHVPLFYMAEKEIIFVFSHVRMLSLIDIKLKEDEKNVPEFLNFGFVFPPLTLYKGIYRLNFNQDLAVDLSCHMSFKIIHNYFIPKKRQRNTA